MLLFNLILPFCFIAASMAIPIQQHQFALQSNTNQHYPITTTATIITNIPQTKKISATYLNEYKSINELELYYSNLVTDVLETTINEILQNAPETYLTIHELQYIGRGSY
ncbi:MAG: hypothetical protein EXX96DRAFT_572653 [Benjaminiella poitrasii]|nr:MAG: hypothetical protein EXX96DRAFT_572653 [Benjaminiella poitrasii]